MAIDCIEYADVELVMLVETTGRGSISSPQTTDSSSTAIVPKPVVASIACLANEGLRAMKILYRVTNSSQFYNVCFLMR